MDNTRAKLPPVLDVTCGGRMMWFDKQHPLALYLDNREIADVELCDGRHFSVRPDIVADFTALPFPDKSFRLVVFDPPHLVRAGEASYTAVKYGRLDPNWRTTLRAGFRECMRVLRPGGTLIFKWNECKSQCVRCWRPSGRCLCLGTGVGEPVRRTGWCLCEGRKNSGTAKENAPGAD